MKKSFSFIPRAARRLDRPVIQMKNFLNPGPLFNSDISASTSLSDGPAKKEVKKKLEKE